MEVTDIIPIFERPDFNATNTTSCFFGLPHPKRDIIYSLNENGTGCVCEKFQIIPHAHGTHIESASHVLNEQYSIPSYLCLPLVTSILTDINDVNSTFEQVTFVILKSDFDSNGFDASIIPKLLHYFPNLRILGTNKQSFDPEYDNGLLSFHRSYFAARPKNFLVELLNLQDERIEIKKEYYCLLNPYFISECTDALPCSPVLIPSSLSQIFPRPDGS